MCLVDMSAAVYNQRLW